MTNIKKKVFVFGAGGWGTALALVLARKGAPVSLWAMEPELVDSIRTSRENAMFLPGVKLPQNVEVTNSMERCIDGASLMVMAVPVKHMRNALAWVPNGAMKGMPVVSVAKGIEAQSLERPSSMIAQLISPPAIAVLSGPSHAEEVARGLPVSLVAASENADLAREMRDLFSSDTIRVYSSDDVPGVEYGGALKNVIAIASGICEGLGLGDNARAALLTRGIVEMARLGTALGGKRDTFYGLSGLGDLITTATSEHGRNRAVGLRVGRGEKAKDILAGMKMVAEGVWTAEAVVGLSAKHGIEMPISNEVYNVLFKDKDPARAVRDLMTRELKHE